MEIVRLQDDSVMEITRIEDDSWNIHWFKENGFDISIVGLTRQGVDEYIQTITEVLA